MNAFDTDEVEVFDNEDNMPRDGRGRLPGDERLHVKFFRRAVKSTVESEAAGRPIYHDKDFVSVMVPGEPNTLLEVFVDPTYINRFPNEWKKFKAGIEAADASGTPLSQVHFLTPAQVAELKGLKIGTVEELAELSGEFLKNIRGGNGLQKKAKDYLEKSEKSVLEQRIAELEALVAAKTPAAE